MSSCSSSIWRFGEREQTSIVKVNWMLGVQGALCHSLLFFMTMTNQLVPYNELRLYCDTGSGHFALFASHTANKVGSCNFHDSQVQRFIDRTTSSTTSCFRNRLRKHSRKFHCGGSSFTSNALSSLLKRSWDPIGLQSRLFYNHACRPLQRDGKADKVATLTLARQRFKG